VKRKSLIALVVLWTLPLLTSIGYAQTAKHPTLTVQIPFEFLVGSRTFPAGTYTFRSLLNSASVKTGIEILEMRSAADRLYSVVVTDLVADSEPSRPRLEFVRSGSRAWLSEVWEPGKSAGCRLQIHSDPAQTAERESGRLTLVASADVR